MNTSRPALEASFPIYLLTTNIFQMLFNLETISTNPFTIFSYSINHYKLLIISLSIIPVIFGPMLFTFHIIGEIRVFIIYDIWAAIIYHIWAAIVYVAVYCFITLHKYDVYTHCLYAFISCIFYIIYWISHNAYGLSQFILLNFAKYSSLSLHTALILMIIMIYITFAVDYDSMYMD
eukprot:517845_1